MRRFGLVALGSLALSGCALKGDVRRVEHEVQVLRAEAARTDSVRAVLLDDIIAAQQRFLDSLAAMQRWLLSFQGTVRTDMTEVQRQLFQIQELTGQSQQRLSELRSRLDRRGPNDPAGTGPGDGVGEAPSDDDLGARQLYDLSLQQLRRGSPQTARAGFRKLIADYPEHPLAADAGFFVGESWEAAQPDSAAAAYESLLRSHPDSRHAPTALYRLGLMAERNGDRSAAEVYYQRVIAGYPRSEEAQLARTKLGSPDR